MTWFDKDSPESLVEEVVKMDGAIRKAEEKLAQVSGSAVALRVYHRREMAMSDMTTGLNHAREEGEREGLQKGRLEGLNEGIRKGLQKGRLEGKLEIALSFKKLGVPVEQIAQGTGLSIEEIKRL
ncbi:MAG: Rpn family recombination-promoting nuclease/putative transposase [Treponema sp.]|nr:Rpn family recombination-promoting nuclease/putative transposase [Treponema sp.]